MTFFAEAGQPRPDLVEQDVVSLPSRDQFRRRLRPVPNNDEGDRANLSLARKLQRFVLLSPDEIGAVLALPGTPKVFGPEHIVVHQGEQPNDVALIASGFAYRFKMLADGRRQIIAYILPGGLCEVGVAHHQTSDHFIALLCTSNVTMFAAEAIADIQKRHPRIATAFVQSKYRDEAILREWMLNIGQRNAVQRISHFFCEMSVRLGDLGLTNVDGSFELPINQAVLADTSGLTTVHVNRILQRLRKLGLIAFRQRRLQILDADRLAALAGFDGSYLRIRGPLS